MDDVRVLTLTGELDIATTGAFQRSFGNVLSKEVRRVVIDLRELAFIDCYALRALIKAHNWRKKQPFVVFVVNERCRAYKLMRLLGIEKQFRLVESVEAAISLGL